MHHFLENVYITLNVCHNGSNEGIGWYMLTHAFLGNLYNVKILHQSGENTLYNNSDQSVHTYM